MNDYLTDLIEGVSDKYNLSYGKIYDKVLIRGNKQFMKDIYHKGCGVKSKDYYYTRAIKVLDRYYSIKRCSNE